MENLKLSTIVCALMFCGGSAYAQASAKVATESIVKPAKVMISKEAVDSVLKDVNKIVPAEKSSIQISVPNLNKDTPTMTVSENKEVNPTNVEEITVVAEEKPAENVVEPIVKSVAFEGGVESSNTHKEQKPLEQNIAQEQRDPNRDYALEERLRKFFIVSDYMMENPINYGGYLLLRDGSVNTVCNFKKPDTFYMLSHEGGSVNPIGSDLIAAKDLKPENEDDYYHQWNKDLNTIKEKCVNVLLGPTVDVNFNERSYSNNLKNNLQISLPIVSSAERKGILPALKHFPGDMMDCAEKFARKDVRSCPQSIDEINEHWKDFKPENYPAIVMSSHVYEKVSPLPAVMNVKLYSYLRGTLGYKGLIVTDVLWEQSVPITEKTVWEMFKYADLMMLINPQEVEVMLPYLANAIKQMPNGTGEQLLQDKEKRIAKAKEVFNN